MATETLEGPATASSSDDESLPQSYQQVVTAEKLRNGCCCCCCHLGGVEVSHTFGRRRELDPTIEALIIQKGLSPAVDWIVTMAWRSLEGAGRDLSQQGQEEPCIWSFNEHGEPVLLLFGNKFEGKYGQAAWKYIVKKILENEDSEEEKDEKKALIAPTIARRQRPKRYELKLKDFTICPT